MLAQAHASHSLPNFQNVCPDSHDHFFLRLQVSTEMVLPTGEAHLPCFRAEFHGKLWNIFWKLHEWRRSTEWVFLHHKLLAAGWRWSWLGVQVEALTLAEDGASRWQQWIVTIRDVIEQPACACRLGVFWWTASIALCIFMSWHGVWGNKRRDPNLGVTEDLRLPCS